MNFLIFGTIWFWITLSIMSGLIIYVLESALKNDDENNGGGMWASNILALFILVYYYAGSKEDVMVISNYIVDNPIQIIGLFFAYLVVGVTWAFFKWYFYVNSLREKAKIRRKQKNDYTYYVSKINVPTFSNNKYRVISWMCYWPFSSFWTFINEPFKKSFEYVFSKIGGTFDNISKKMFADVIKQNEDDIFEAETKKAAAEEESVQRHNKRQQLNS